MTSTRDAWNAALSVIDQLRTAGHIALLAGGCVRDRLLGRSPNDYDVATNALPERVRELFPKARMVGAKFGVALVHRFGHDIEVATFRSDGTYSDGRRPDEVMFGNEREDALRRDFTINGLFYDPVEDRVIDHVHGQQDLHARVIRTIGDPEVRFAEDHLRMLRAVRLSARLGFSVDPETASAIVRLSSNLRAISPERIWMELEQVLAEPTRSEGWRLINNLGLRAHLSADWPTDRIADALAEKRLNALRRENVDAELALAATLPDAPLDHVEAICRSFRLSNQQIGQIAWLKNNLAAAHVTSLELADFKPLCASSWWPLLLEFLRIDLLARGGELPKYEKARSRGETISPEQAAPSPLVTGDDLLALGFSAGQKLGDLLCAVYRAQLNETISSRDQGIALAREIAQQQQR